MKGTKMDKEKNNEILDTNVYTYKVDMVIQIFAEDEKTAKERLDANGGYITSRIVKLMDSIPLFNGKTKE